MEDGDLEVEERISLYAPLMSGVVPMKESVSETSWRGAQKERIAMLGKALSSRLKPLQRNDESGFEVSLRSEGTQKWFLMFIFYSCNVPKANHMSAVWHSAERKQLCVSCRSPQEDIVVGRRRSSRVQTETMDVRRRVKEMQEDAAHVTKRDRRKRIRKVAGKTDSLLSGPITDGRAIVPGRDVRS